MQAFLEFVDLYRTWVYLGLFALCALKSGAFPLFAGVAAHGGALDPSLAAGSVFAGGYLGDEARFAIARRYGARFMMRYPRLGRRFEQAQELMARNATSYIFIYRYPKGLRAIGALPVGMTQMPWRRFTILNGASAALWTALLVGCGYAFGGAIATAIERGWGLFSIALLAVFGLIGIWLWRRHAPTLKQAGAVDAT